MPSNKSTAHLTGAIYAVLVISGMITLLYVPSKLIVEGDIATTVTRIIASEVLFGSGILSAMVWQVCYVVLPLVLHKLFKPVDEAQAILMVAFALVRVPISFVSIANNLDVLALLSGVGKVNVLSPADVNAQVMLQLATAANQTFVAELFWGLWLLPFGLLVYRSGFLPKVLGTFLMARCVGYLIDTVSQVMWPVSYRASGVSAFVNLPSAAGEIGTCLWMLIMGRRRRAPTCLAREVDEVRCALQRRRQFRGPAERSMSSRGRGARGQLDGDATTLWSGALCLEAQIIKHFQYTVAAVSQKA